MSYGVGHRCVLDPALLWLWHRSVAVTLIRPLAWKPSYATSAALKRKRKKQNKNKKINRILLAIICWQILQSRRNRQISRDIQPAKLNQEKIDQLNNLMARNEIEYVIKILPTNKSQGPDGFMGKFYHP